MMDVEHGEAVDIAIENDNLITMMITRYGMPQEWVTMTTEQARQVIALLQRAVDAAEGDE